MVLGKLPVPGSPTIWITVGQVPIALAVGWFGHFYSHLPFLLFLPLFGRRPDIDLNIVSKSRLTQNNQPTESGWFGDVMVLGKVPVPRHPSNLADSRARAYCACSKCGWIFFYIFTLIYLFFPILSLYGRRPDID